MPAYIETWDPSVPAGSRDISLGDDDIRSMKRAMTERLGEDHEFQTDETGNGNIGYHKKCTLTKRSADPDPVTDAGILFTKDVGSSVIELFYEDAAGNVLQMTSSGSLKRLSKEVAMWFGSVATIPSGWYLCNGQGGRPDLRDKFIVGAMQDSAGVAMTTVEGALAQSANPTHSHGGYTGATTLTIAQIPAHSHVQQVNNSVGGSSKVTTYVNQSGVIASDFSTAETGGGTSHDHSIAAGTSIPTYYALCFISQYNQ